jgi:hypothetical protein
VRRFSVALVTAVLATSAVPSPAATPAGDGFVTLYDEFGRAAVTVQNRCIGTRHVLASHAALFVLCEPGDRRAPTLAACSLGV